MMKISKYIEKDGAGRVALIPENPEDMWHAYNLISQGDTVRSSTIRKVQTESATGSSSSSRVRTMITIEVETIDFDTQACMLRLKGRNVEENQYVKMGAYHTVDIETNRKFTLQKSCWDIVALERIDMACDPTQNADVAAVIMQEGLAHVCLVTGAMTLVRAKIDVNIPRKRKGNASQHEKGLQKFYDNVLQAILRHINFDVTRCILLASPGFVKDHFFEFMMQWAVKSDNRTLIDNKSKFLLIHSSSGFKHSLKEVLADPAVASRMADTKATAEVKALENFYSVLQTEPSRAFYGFKHVLKANEAQAIDTLLISDNLFRSQSVEERKKYVALVESVRDYGGVARIFSSLHVSGEQLAQLTGVAAILRFPMPELEEEPLDSDED
nr:EOG090X07BV [Macrothrix elegans]